MKDFAVILLVCAGLSGAHWLGKREGFADAKQKMELIVSGYVAAACPTLPGRNI